MKGFLGFEDEENNEDGDSNENIRVKNYYDTMKYYNKLLNESKIEIFINNEKYENKKYFNPKEVGLYQIKLKFNSNITSMSYMFLGCSDLMSIDLSSFDSREVNTMNEMFYECDGLKNINLSFLDSKNVTNMSFIFGRCFNLKKLMYLLLILKMLLI